MQEDIKIKDCVRYEAILPSDGISIRLPKEYAKIKKVRQLLDWLEEEIKEDAKKAKEQQAKEVKKW